MYGIVNIKFSPVIDKGSCWNTMSREDKTSYSLPSSAYDYILLESYRILFLLIFYNLSYKASILL